MAQSRKTAKKKVATRRASKALANVKGRRIKPLDSLPDGAKATWAEIVNALPAEFYGEQDRPLLGQYVYSAWLAEREIIRETKTPGSGDAAIRRDAVAVMGKFGPQLRLAPSSRTDPKVAGTANRRAAREYAPPTADPHDWRSELAANPSPPKPPTEH
jgi:hypothetical protein